MATASAGLSTSNQPVWAYGARNCRGGRGRCGYIPWSAPISLVSLCRLAIPHRTFPRLTRAATGSKSVGHKWL